MSRFADKVALVIGGRSGIGLACAERLAADGVRVLTAQRGESAFETIAADLSDPAMPRHVIDEVIARAGRLDILINNAGIMHEGTAEEMTVADWNATLTVNLTAPFMLIKFALPHLKQTNGTIINIGSIEGIWANPRHPAYCASKAGLHGLTRAIAVDHGVDGIRCNAVAPGWIETELNNNFIEAQPHPTEFRAQIDGIHPVRRTGTPAEVAALVRWLASEDAAFVTGQIYTIDGGQTAQLSLR